MISVRDVSMAFGGLQALADINVEVAEGEFVTLLGPSGSGKTTLLRIIAGLQQPSVGATTIAGADPGIARRAKRIGWVPQTPALLPWRTVRDNISLLTEVGRSRSDSNRVHALIEQVGLDGFAEALPHQLSGGMQQRVGLARALILQPTVLLMDEPFAALDEITRTDMRHLLLDLWQETGAAVVFVTHSLAEAAYLSDRVVVLSQRPGRIVATHTIDATRPRTPALEDDPAFFTNITALRESLHRGMA